MNRVQGVAGSNPVALTQGTFIENDEGSVFFAFLCFSLRKSPETAGVRTLRREEPKKLGQEYGEQYSAALG